MTGEIASQQIDPFIFTAEAEASSSSISQQSTGSKGATQGNSNAQFETLINHLSLKRAVPLNLPHH